MDSVLLFALAVPVVMTYRISPGETPYWLFGVIFLLLGVNLFIQSLKYRTWLTWIVILLTIGSVYFSAIVVRQRTAPVYEVHDIILQLESATRFLIQGINPYAADYFGTPLEEWHYGEGIINPALFHFVMPPFYLLSFLPFYYGGVHLFSLVDGRLPLVFAFFGILFLLHKLVKKEERPLALTLFAFNPAMVGYFIEGRSDYQMFFWLLSALFVLSSKHVILSGILMGLAFATKQSAWPIFPLYIAYLWFKGNKKWVVYGGVSLLITVTLIFLPFLLWDYKTFLNSTLFYLSGSLATSYPISGYGVGMLLNQLGLIKNLNTYFPFWILQLVLGLPALIILIKQLQAKPTLKRLLFFYGVFLFVFWYFSRYFNNSHVGFLSSIFIISYFLPKSN